MDTPEFSNIELISMGNVEFKNKLLAILKTEFPVELEQFEFCFKNGELGLAAEVVHKLKHKINLLNMKNDYKLARQFEIDLSNGKSGSCNDFKVIMNNITTFLNSFKIPIK